MYRDAYKLPVTSDSHIKSESRDFHQPAGQKHQLPHRISYHLLQHYLNYRIVTAAAVGKNLDYIHARLLPPQSASQPAPPRGSLTEKPRSGGKSYSPWLRGPKAGDELCLKQKKSYSPANAGKPSSSWPSLRDTFPIQGRLTICRLRRLNHWAAKGRLTEGGRADVPSRRLIFNGELETFMYPHWQLGTSMQAPETSMWAPPATGNWQLPWGPKNNQILIK